MTFKPVTAFPPPVVRLADFIRDLLDVAHVPADVTCHGLCRGLLPVLKGLGFNVALHDGYFGPYSATHSWLTEQEHPNYIVDPYPWACQPYPLVVCAEILSPWSHIYRPGDDYLERHVKDPTIAAEAAAVEKELRRLKCAPRDRL